MKKGIFNIFLNENQKALGLKVNKEKIEQLIAKGLMTQTGLDCIKIAKQNGSWEILDSVEALLIPKDLETALRSSENAMDFFMSLSKSVKKMMLCWVVSAKRKETRQKRIIQIAELASKGLKPKQF